jgi:hypothetical protein
MVAVLLAGFLAAAALPQAAPIGIFTGSADVGAPRLEGSAEYDPATKAYTITGTGADIWARQDQFHYVWKEMRGNFTVTATTTFLTDGNPHRKASIMLRKSLDTDAAFLHLAIHGDGMPSVQYRATQGDDVRTLDFPIEGPGMFTLRLARQGSAIRFFVAKDGGPLRDLGSTQSSLGSPVMVGLGVASHSVDALHTVRFSNVSIDGGQQ